jgi:histidinol-phosphate aminotransferase
VNKVKSPRAVIDELTAYNASHFDVEVELSANESPYEIPEEARRDFISKIEKADLNRYPDPLADTLREMLASRMRINSDSVLIGNGGDEILHDVMIAWSGKGRSILQFPPTFAMYEIYAKTLEADIVSIPRDPQTMQIDFPKAKERLAQGDIAVCFIDTPNNPSGVLADPATIEDLLASSDTLFIVDEAYVEFSQSSVMPLVKKHKNLLILRTFSKAYCLAGLRLGYCVAHPEVIEVLKKVRMPYSVNVLSQLAGETVLHYQELFTDNWTKIISERERLTELLKETQGIQVWESKANFILFKTKNATKVWDHLWRDHSVLIRNLSTAPHLEDCLRVTVGTPEENDVFMDALGKVLLTVFKEDLVAG